jgi:hypothetical protein
VQRLPCRDMSAFAELERAQSQQPQVDQAHAPPSEENTPEETDTTAPNQQARFAERKHHPRNLLRRAPVNAAGNQQSEDKHEAKEHHHRALHQRHGHAQS